MLDKVGTFGMITLCLPLFPEASRWAAPAIIVLALISIIYGGLLAVGQRDIMRLIAFTSVSHFGFMVLGIFVRDQVALTGAMLYMVAHGVSTAALFLIAGFLTRRGGTQQIPAYGGMQRVTPVLAGTFLVAGLASIALPGLSGFVPEFLVIQGTFRVNIVAAVVAVLGVIIAAVYILLPYQRIFTGPKVPELARIARPRRPGEVGGRPAGRGHARPRLLPGAGPRRRAAGGAGRRARAAQLHRAPPGARPAPRTAARSSRPARRGTTK